MTDPEPKHTKRSKRRPSSGKPLSGLNHTEKVFFRQVLWVMGVALLGASLWFAANSSGTLIRVAKKLVAPQELLQDQPHATSDAFLATPAEPEVTPEKPSASVWMFSLSIILVWGGLQWITRLRRRAEFQTISVFFVFLALLLLIRLEGWNPVWVFSLLVLISWGNWIFSRHLSHTAMRFQFLFTWGVFFLWWVVRILIKNQVTELPFFFLFSSLFFLSFHAIILLRGFAGHRKLTRLFEVLTIVVNPLLYLMMVIVTLVRFFEGTGLFFLLLGICILFLCSLLLLEFRNRPYRKLPLVITTLVLLSLLLPMLFRQNQLMLFSGSLSLLLMLYARESRNQPSILVSLGLAVLMLLLYLKDFVISYIPVAFFAGWTENQGLFTKGLTTGIFVPLVAFLLRKLLKDTPVSFSRKWFNRHRYLKLLKGMMLLGLYTGLLWIWQYLFFRLLPVETEGFVTWMAFHSLYFSVAIPWLARQNSSFLPVSLVTSLVLTGLYPTIVSIQTVNGLHILVHGEDSPGLFLMVHYLASFLFLVYLAVLAGYGSRAFGNKSLARRLLLIYIVFMGMFTVAMEILVSTVWMTAGSQMDIPAIQRTVSGLPVSLVLAFTGLILLGTGLIRNRQFTRVLGLLLLLLTAVKLIAYDQTMVSGIMRVILFFGSGTVFIGLSVAYRPLVRTFVKKHHTRRPGRKARTTTPGTNPLTLKPDETP